MMNLGIIGLGNVPRYYHIPEANKTGKFFIKAAADIFEDTSVAKRFNIPEYYTDYRRILDDPSIDAVLILTPHDCHEEQCIAAFEAGKHVLIEKPIARNLGEAERIIAAAKKAGTVGMIGFNERYVDEHVYIKSVVDSKVLGRLLSARVDHYQNFNPPKDSWWRSKEQVGGGAVIGSGIHRLDLLRWYLGEAVSVYAKAVDMPERLESEACVHAVIEFDSGVIANFSVNWACYNYLYYEGLSISGENGLIVTGPANKLGLAEIDNGMLKDFTPPRCQTMYEHFAECIEKGTTPITSLEEGYKSLQLVRAIYKSLETGTSVVPQTVTF